MDGIQKVYEFLHQEFGTVKEDTIGYNVGTVFFFFFIKKHIGKIFAYRETFQGDHERRNRIKNNEYIEEKMIMRILINCRNLLKSYKDKLLRMSKRS